jgi:GTP cyclohydrolase I
VSDQRKHQITYDELARLLERVQGQIVSRWEREPIRAYPVPRGGVPVAGMHPLRLVSDPDQADVVIDDLIDSGATRQRFSHLPFYALIDKRADAPYRNAWVVWPWEAGTDGDIEDNVRRLLQYVGEDPGRGGLLETPARVAKAWRSWCSGYDQDPAEVLKVFEDGAEAYDEMVVVKDIPFYSKCEHHMADIFGTATIAYVPDGKIVGLSKLSRLLDVFARRLQVQERCTIQVADALMQHLQPRGAGVVIKARHMCMESRGVRQQGHVTVSCALRGVFKDQAATRAEFLALTHR